MRRFIITGAPGAGKTAIIRRLELDGFSVVEEAATDVIAEAQARGTAQPWTNPSFIDAIATLQRDRQIPCSPVLAGELERVKREAIYENRVFFIRHLGFAPTKARRISLEDMVRFEKVHEETYRDFGFELIPVEPGGLVERVEMIKAAIR